MSIGIKKFVRYLRNAYAGIALGHWSPYHIPTAMSEAHARFLVRAEDRLASLGEEPGLVTEIDDLVEDLMFDVVEIVLEVYRGE